MKPAYILVALLVIGLVVFIMMQQQTPTMKKECGACK